MSSDKYRQVRKLEQTEVKENEIRIKAKGIIGAYASYAASLFKGSDKTEAKDVVILKAMGSAICKTILTAEVIKRRVDGLHQITELGSSTIKQVFEPLEEGLETIENERSVPYILISLSKSANNTSDVGYQAPDPNLPPLKRNKAKRTNNRGAATPSAETATPTATEGEEGAEKPKKKRRPNNRRGNRRGRGKNGRGKAPEENKEGDDSQVQAETKTEGGEEGADQDKTAKRGRGGRGRGRARRGRGRGGRGRGASRGRRGGKQGEEGTVTNTIPNAAETPAPPPVAADKA